ncbi:MAG TPA: DUF4136 domain-containing protein [Terriglobales bacterium]|nr:DUF4136 domain-containing protein [Terriglobales bacterium]
MKRLTLIPVILFIFVCAYAQDVHYNYDRGANFAVYKTYQWVDEPPAEAKVAPPSGLPRIGLPGGGPLPVSVGTSDDQLIRQDIQRVVDEQLEQKGLTRVESNADLLVTYHAAIREEQSLNLSAFGTGGGPWGWGGGWGGLESGTVTGRTSAIPIGTLVVDLYDPARKQLVWRGDATKTIDVKKEPDKNYRALQKAMSKLFKNYPPPAGK